MPAVSPSQASPRVLRGTAEARAIAALVAVSVALSFTATLVRLAAVPPATTGFFRCALALPFLLPLAVHERRRSGVSRGAYVAAAGAGVALAADLELWHHAIGILGAGLATVIASVHVILVGVVGWVRARRIPSVAIVSAIGLLLLGVTLVSGHSPPTSALNPSLGAAFGLLTAVAYTVFLLTMRRATRLVDAPARLLTVATVACAFSLAAVGASTNELVLRPSLRALVWLFVMAITAQFLAYLVFTVAVPHVPVLLASCLLLLQPVLGVAVAAAVVGERPALAQLAGAGLIILGLAVATADHRGAAPLAEIAALDSDLARR